MSVHNTVQRHPLQPASGSMSSPHLNGIDGRSNVTDFHNRVVYPLGLTEGVEFSWVSGSTPSLSSLLIFHEYVATHGAQRCEWE